MFGFRKKTVLVPLSGGLDSTYVAYTALKKGYKVLPVYVKYKNLNIAKSTIESQQCTKIHSLLMKEFGKNVLPLQKIDAKDLYFSCQFELWIQAIKYNVDLTEISYVYLGVTKSDIDASLTTEDIDSRIDYSKVHLKKEINFPLIDLTKEQISHLLPKKYLENTYTCEMPLYNKDELNQIFVTQCKKCNSCHLSKLNNISLNGPFFLETSISDNDISENNEDHRKYIHTSNFYGQQKEFQHV